MPVITLTTDFGAADHFVGTMKGVILGIAPRATLVDITHEIAPQDVGQAAFVIAQSWRYFPNKTIHVIVVDPGVGSERRPLLAEMAGQYFIAPDNGVLSMVLSREEPARVRHITAEKYFLHPVSRTFHGRDIFATVAGWLSTGLEPSDFGPEITDYVRLSLPAPKPGTRGIEGVVLKIDKFGNVVTNITPRDAPQLFAAAPPAFRIVIGKHEIISLRNSYAGGAAREIFAILGSMGFLELAMNRGSAAEALGVEKGAGLTVAIAEAPQPQNS